MASSVCNEALKKSIMSLDISPILESSLTRKKKRKKYTPQNFQIRYNWFFLQKSSLNYSVIALTKRTSLDCGISNESTTLKGLEVNISESKDRLLTCSLHSLVFTLQLLTLRSNVNNNN